MKTTTITAKLQTPAGTALAGAAITAKLSGYSAYDGVVLPVLTSATTAEDGTATLAVWPNIGAQASTYTFVIEHPRIQPVTIAGVTVPDTGAVTLAELLGWTNGAAALWNDSGTWNDSSTWSE